MSADIWIEQPCRNQSAGELKGDELIVFGLDATRSVGGNNEISSSSDDGQVATANGGSGIDPVETACTQMNGVDLPCGTAIGVEPADRDWRRRGKKFKMDCHHVQLFQQQ